MCMYIYYICALVMRRFLICVHNEKYHVRPKLFHSVLARLFPWQSNANADADTTDARIRLRGKRTLLSNLRNWISRDIVASVARLTSEPFQSPHARLHHRKLIGRVFGRQEWKSFFLSLYPWTWKLFRHWEEEAMAIPFISPRSQGRSKTDKYKRTNTPLRDSLEFSLIS